MRNSIPPSDRLLAAWYALEMLTPQPLPSVDDLAGTNRARYKWADKLEPWFAPELSLRPPQEKNVAWWVILGEIDLAATVQRLLRVFPDEYRDEREYAEGSAPMAVIVLDANGRLAADKSFVASFAWATGCVLQDRTAELPEFAAAEIALKSGLSDRLRQQTPDGAIRPVTGLTLSEAVDWLRESMQLPRDLFLSDGFALRIPLRSEATELPEPEFLNSFFLRDLGHALMAMRSGSVAPGSPFARYMAARPPKAAYDIVADPALRRELLAPARCPAARWPGRRLPDTKQRPALALMQQAAVNVIARDLAEQGLFAINGPPGTGKTTLLRDLFAHVVCARAEAMADFDVPSAAFTPIEGADYAWGNVSRQLHRVDARLLDHEMVVVSSNNGAVENVSGELPQAKHLADDLAEPLGHFEEIARRLYPADQPDKACWGLVAGILGKKQNRDRFAEIFWWDEEVGLKHRLGRPVPANERRHDKAVVPPQPLERGVPPTPRVPKPWPVARQEFREILAATRRDLATLEAASNALARLDAARVAVCSADRAHAEADQNHEQCQHELQHARQRIAAHRELLQLREAERREHGQVRPRWWQPAWWRWLLGSEDKRRWQEHDARLSARIGEARSQLARSIEAELAAKDAACQAKMRLTEAVRERAQRRGELARLEETVAAAKPLAGELFADGEFWARPEDELQRLSPWLGPAVQEKRDEVFAAALRVHEAFAFAAGAPLRENLDLFFRTVFKGKSLKDEHAEHYRSLWSSLFLIVPLISTTFASVERMIRQTRQPLFGWLFIDEAGQAQPQYAIGALLRARRAVVVGDPLQIPPVVTTPPRLVDAVCRAFGVDAARWAGPDASVQTQADRATWLGTHIPLGEDATWVGCPLRVHRRCQEPMFSVANRIAYQGLMVFATARVIETPLVRVLGESAWIDVRSSSESKYVPAEGAVLRTILEAAKRLGVDAPDLYVISPFKHVAQGLRREIAARRYLHRWLHGESAAPRDEQRSPKPRIGTVHTVQGKEARVVFLVLGAQGEERQGARRWAASPPNLVNVAVTRAQHRLFVIGHYDEWKDVGCVRELARHLAKRRFAPEAFLTRFADSSRM